MVILERESPIEPCQILGSHTGLYNIHANLTTSLLWHERSNIGKNAREQVKIA